MIIKKIVNRIYRSLRKIKRINLKGHIIEIWVNKTKKRAFIFKDWAGNLYIQNLGDKIAFNIGRNAVSDAINITNLVDKLVQNDWICIDIGGCIGAISIPMWKKVFPKGHVYTIEADPNNINKIKLNLLLNGFPDEFVYNYAICDKNEDVELNIIPENNGWQSLGNPRSDPRLSDIANRIYTEIVNGKTLEEFCNSQSIKKIDFLKIDVEGAELEVFKGSSKLLREHAIEYIAFEISPPMLKWFSDDRNVKQVIDFIAQYGYSIYRIFDNGNIKKLVNNRWPKGMWGDCLAVAPGTNISSDIIMEK